MAAIIDTGVVATSSIQIVDIFDAPIINTFVKSNNSLGQLYNPADKTYRPDFRTTPLVLTATALDPVTHQETIANISKVTWSYQYNDQAGVISSTDNNQDWYVSGTKGEVLNIKANFLPDSLGATFTALISYTDPAKNTTSTNSVQTTITMRNLVKSSIILNTYSPSGYNIVNGLPSAVNFTGDLYTNGTLDTVTHRSNDWFRQDTSVTSTSNPNYDSRAGLGWAKITTAYTQATVNSEFGASVLTSAGIVVSPDDVINVESYKLITTPQEGEHNGSPQQGFFTAYNFDSALTIAIQSLEGTIFKNGTGNKNMKAILYNTVGEVDKDGTKYAYYWYLYKAGVLDPTFGGTGKKTGKSILVSSNEIDDNSTLIVEVEGT